MARSGHARVPLFAAVLTALAATLLAVPTGASAAAGSAAAVAAPRSVANAVAARPAKHRPKVRCGKHRTAVRVTPPKPHKKHKKAKWRCVKVPRKLVKQRTPQQQLVRAGTRLPAVRVGGKTYQLHTPPVFARSLKLGVPRLPASLFTGASEISSGYLTSQRASGLEGHGSIDIPETGAHVDLTADFTGGNFLLEVTVTTKEGDSMSVTYGYGSTIDTCPNVQGKVHGTAKGGTELHFDLPRSGYKGEWPFPGAPDSRVFLHLTMMGRGTGTARTTNQAKVDTFDLNARMVNHVQVGTKSAAGTVLQTNEPRVLQADAYTRAAPRMPDDSSKLTGWVVAVWGRTEVEGQYRASDWGGQAKALELYQREWGATLVAFGDGLNSAEQDHWTKAGQCLDVRLKANRTTLRPGQSATITATLVPKNGPKVARAALTGKATDGTLDPDKASSKGPVTFRFTAPKKKWRSATVTVRAVSKQGIGKGQITLSRQQDSYQLVFSTDLRQSWPGGDKGSGSAQWVGTARPVLKEGPDGVWTGATTYGWSTYQYAHHGIPMGCQAGGEGHDDVDAAGTKPGRLTIARLTGADGGASALSVQLRVQAPVDTLRRSFSHDATSCADFASTYNWSILPPLRWQLATKPGVAMTGSGNEDSALFTITGWKKGTGSVLAYKDLAWTQSGGTENYHVRLELRAQT